MILGADQRDMERRDPARTDDVTTERTPPPMLWALLDLVDDAVVAVDVRGMIRHLNAAAPEVFGVGTEYLVGRPLAVLVPDGARADHHAHMAAFAGSGEQLRRMSARSGVQGRRTDGSEFPAEVSICRIEHEGEVLLLAFVRDVTERHALREQLDWIAHHDPVTGLRNRAGMVEALSAHLVAPVGVAAAAGAAAGAADGPVGGRAGMLFGAVVMVDIEGFGFVNHAYGTDAGDRVLHALGERLADFDEFGPAQVARLGDDEFVVHLPEVVDDATLEHCAERLVDRLERAVVLEDHVIEVRVAVGARPGTFRPTTPDEALSDAAAALAEGRVRGRRQLVTFDEQVRQRSSERVHLLNELWSAIEKDELDLVYQPIVEAWSGRPQSAEALLRWTHPTLGSVSPEVFVPLAEQTDLIEELSCWVLHRAAHQVAEWTDAAWCGDDFRVAVNISARQLRGRSVVDDLQGAIAAASIAPERLRIEVTETAAMDDLALGFDVLSQIAELGVSLALDDFGAGHSSLARMGRLPIDQIKIDRSFVSGVDRDPVTRALIDAILAIADVFGVKVVAEGVERHTQLEELQALGCPLIQGWYFARAQGAHTFAVTAELLARAATESAHRCADRHCNCTGGRTASERSGPTRRARAVASERHPAAGAVIR